MGYDMTERLQNDDAMCSPFEYFDELSSMERRKKEDVDAEDEALKKQYAEEDRLEGEMETVEGPNSKKRKKKKKRQSVEDRRAEIDFEDKQASSKRVDNMLTWLKKFRDFFNRHLIHRSSSPVSAEEEGRIASLESMTLLMRERRARTGLIIDTSSIAKSSSFLCDPLQILAKSKDDSSCLNKSFIESLDLGTRFQESIELYESIAKEIDALACIGYLESARERSMSLSRTWTQQWQEKYGMRALSRERMRSARSGKSIEPTMSSEGKSDEEADILEGVFTARSVQFTARSNTSEANALMDMALGDSHELRRKRRRM